MQNFLYGLNSPCLINEEKRFFCFFLLAGGKTSPLTREGTGRCNCRWMLLSHVLYIWYLLYPSRNEKKKKAACFFFSFRQWEAQSSVTSLHIVATAKGCNLFGLESRSSKWSADNSPEVSFKRVPLFNYFLGDLWRQCDNETVSFTCG